MKRIFLGLCVVGATLYGLWYYYGPKAETSGLLTLYGNVDIREVQLGFRTAGRLRQMHYEEGDVVRSGDLLAALDDEPALEALAVVEAQVLEAQAHLDRMSSGSRPQEIEQARAHVEEASAALQNARQELRRQKELNDSGLNSERQLDASIAASDQAAARLAASEEALALAREGARSEDIMAARAAQGGALARREQARTQVEDTQLYAPNDGIILTRAREPGAMLSVGAVAYTLSLTDTVYVRAYVDEPRLGHVQPGALVNISTDSSQKRYQGQVGFISPRAEFTPKTVQTPELRTDLVYRLRIVVVNADGGLRQGMPVTIEIPPPKG
ncbi:MAG: secretion protein HlyD [Halieaceae bacterium]|nr:secretion protein HlyD [Halieaceae bacterium]